MPIRGIDRCLDVMSALKAKGIEHGAEVACSVMLDQIEITIGPDKRTRDKYIPFMQKLGFFEMIGEGMIRIDMHKADMMFGE